MQERRRGTDSHLSGSRLSGSRSRDLNGPPIAYEGSGRDDKWRPNTCDSCKIPDYIEKLLVFELRLHGRPAGAWTLCQKCWEWRNHRPDPDPLTLPEVAA